MNSNHSCSDFFSKTRIRSTGILNETYCRNLLQEHMEGRRDNNRQIWTLFSSDVLVGEQSRQALNPGRQLPKQHGP